MDTSKEENEGKVGTNGCVSLEHPTYVETQYALINICKYQSQHKNKACIAMKTRLELKQSGRNLTKILQRRIFSNNAGYHANEKLYCQSPQPTTYENHNQHN